MLSDVVSLFFSDQDSVQLDDGAGLKEEDREAV